MKFYFKSLVISKPRIWIKWVTKKVFDWNKKFEYTKIMFKNKHYCLLNDKKERSKYLVLRPGARKNLTVIESHTTDTF